MRAALGPRLHHHDGNDIAAAARVAAEHDVAVVVVGYTHLEEGESILPSSPAGLTDLVPVPAFLRRIVGPRGGAWWHKALRIASQRGLDFLRKRLERQDQSFGLGGDRSCLHLPQHHVDLLQAVAAANPKTVVAIVAGSAVVTTPWDAQVPAIMLVWYPGMEGGHAFADLLTGKANPSGKLPFVVPRHESHLPSFDSAATSVCYDMWHGYRYLERDEREAAYPFGFGLSYTSYRYRDLQIEQPVLRPGDTLKVSLQVDNAGAVAGDEIVQLYVSVLASAVERAPRELKAFARVSLAAGEGKRVALAVPLRKLAYFDEKQDDFVVECANYRVTAARYCGDDEALSTTFAVVAPSG